MDAAPVLEILREALPDVPLVDLAGRDMPTIRGDRDHLLDLCRVLRDHPDLQFALLVDMTVVDRLPAAPRFEAVYHFTSLGEAYATGPVAPLRRLRLKVGVPGDDPRLASVVPIYPVANWLEREAYDLFGIHFDGHPDLRRILMPDEWEGHPLRKDYPVQIRKDTEASSPIELTAEEFAENIRAARARAARPAPGATGGGGTDAG